MAMAARRRDPRHRHLRCDRRHVPGFEFDQDRRRRLVSARRRRGYRDPDAVVAQGLFGRSPSSPGYVDAAQGVSRLCRQGLHRPRSGNGSVADQGRARCFADAAAMPTSTTRTITSRMRPSFVATRDRRWSQSPLRFFRFLTASRAGHPISSKFPTTPSSRWDSA